jgi:hypothetical protein
MWPGGPGRHRRNDQAQPHANIGYGEERVKGLQQILESGL